MDKLWIFCKICNEVPDTNNDFIFTNYNPLPLDSIEANNFPKKGIPGLSNFEGNCYLNSVLQCFYYCDNLTNYFINHKNEIIKKNGKLSNAYLNLVLRLKKEEIYNNAKNFLDALQEVSFYFFKKGGNDPKAVLLYLMENLHNELKEKTLCYNEEDICCEGTVQKDVFQKCKNNEQNNKSIITELFNWCLITSNVCIKCGNTHYSCEYRNHILIELKSYKTIEENVSLNELIKFYFQDSNEYFVCTFKENNDKEVFKVTKTKKIISIPQYLIIILNRDIIQYNVKYDDIIDLSEYCVDEYNVQYSFMGASLTNDFGYKVGTHAISRCLTLKGSIILNDLNSKKNCDNIKGYNPYILFYQRCFDDKN